MIGGMLATFLIVLGVAGNRDARTSAESTLAEGLVKSPQYRARSMGGSAVMMPLMTAAIKAAAKDDSTNQKYLRLLKMANWYWAPGEAAPPSLKAPFWNLETLWGEKYIKGMLIFTIVFSLVAILGALYGSGVMGYPLYYPILGGLALGGIGGLMGFSDPEGLLQGAAASRQRELGLEMGFRIGELRSDVLAGYTIQRAIRNMSQRAGGPFAEELKRVVTVLNTTKDETLAMDSFMDRNAGNELVQEFANQIKMVSREGGEIAPALNVLTDAAQNRLRQQIVQQGRKNLQEMSRPVGIVSLFVTALLILLPVVYSIMSTIGKF